MRNKDNNYQERLHLFFHHYLILSGLMHCKMWLCEEKIYSPLVHRLIANTKCD